MEERTAKLLISIIIGLLIFLFLVLIAARYFLNFPLEVVIK
jgi:hypothetical protein